MAEVAHRRLIIVGSGPAGNTAAIYAARANLAPLVIQGIEPGGQLTTTTDVDNWPADADGVQGPELMERFDRHARRFGCDIVSDHVEEVIFGSPHRLCGSDNYSCDALIIATGASARYLGLASEQRYRGKGVSACATCDGFFFRNRTVAVIGGGNTAVEEALFLANICAQVILVHRRDSFRAEAIMQDRLFAKEKEGKVKIIRSHVLDEVLGDDQKVTGARLRSVADETQMQLEVAGIFIAIGHEPNSALFAGKLDMENGYVKVAAGRNGMATATSQPGVFAAGDIADHVYRQAVTSAGSGCMAALDAVRYLEENN